MKFSDDQKKQFNKDGYIIAKSLFSSEEIEILAKTTKTDAEFTDHDDHLVDSSGLKTVLNIRYHLQDDISSAFVASQRIVENMEFLLEDEVYHYHHKMTLKKAKVGGAWEWHQDYGYWYNIACLYPDMASCAIAVDPSTKENGCLKLLKGSHLCGRIDHGEVGSQTGADVERVAELEKRLPLVYAEMDPGDALFFHSNTLHSSSANLSPNPRWLLIGCYNTKHNSPYSEESGLPLFHPLKQIADKDLLVVAEQYYEKSLKK